MITINPEKLRDIENAKAKVARAAAFAREHDPLVGKVLRGEASADELVAVAADIRTRFPYQE